MGKVIKLGSLFDGSGGFPLAGVLHGIEPVWASEIEPYPIRVTKARFPHMKHLGDVTKINGAEIEPVDIITFGSPCQDLSVAGKQKGIHEGERSNLFFEAVRIIKEMRKNDEMDGRTDLDIRPRFAVWENVPGAFSSNGGEDFRAVLEALGSVREDGLSIPRPARWNHAGCVVGDGWSIAWRVYDAQYWGVPQRRKRIYLIADFASERAGEILFEREGVRGDTEAGREAGQGAAADAERGAGGSGVVGFKNRAYVTGEKTETLRAESHMALPCVTQPAAFMGGQGAKARSIAYCDDGTTPTLKLAPSGGNTVPDVCYPINTMVATRGGKDDMRTCFGIGEPNDPQFTLGANHEHAVCYAIQGNTIDRGSVQNGSGVSEDVSPTINTQDRHGVVYPEVARSLCARADSSPCVDRGQNVIVCNSSGNGIAATLDASYYKGTGARNGKEREIIAEQSGNKGRKYVIRRLTPLECCRLQGFPDWWEDGVEGSDSARYKMWGNGIALPCAADVIGRIVNAIRKDDAE